MKINIFKTRKEVKTVIAENGWRGKDWIKKLKKFKQEVIPSMKQKRIKYRIEKEILEPSWKTNRTHIANVQQKNAVTTNIS
ncbi:hypothetical protein C5B41_17130, partial [Acinetobacter ursingii]